MAFPPSFLAEDNSASLLDTCIFFIVIEAIFIVLMYMARYVSSDNKANKWMTLLLTSAYCTCLFKITIAICKPSMIVVSCLQIEAHRL